MSLFCYLLPMCLNMKTKDCNMECNLGPADACIGLIPADGEAFDDIVDELSAWRSFKGFVCFIIVAALVFTFVFNVFYGIYHIENISIDNDGIAVAANKTVKKFNKGDAVIIRINDSFYCAEFSRKSDARSGIYAKVDEEDIFISDDMIEGRAEIILFPVSSFSAMMRGVTP